MVKAKIEAIRPGEDGKTYSISVNFPEFAAAAGMTQLLVFEAVVSDYQAWTPPPEVDKTPSNYVEYDFIRPAYAKLENIQSTLKPLVGKEFDW